MKDIIQNMQGAKRLEMERVLHKYEDTIKHLDERIE